MNKPNILINYIALIVTIILSFLSICTYDHHPRENYNEYYDILKFLTPGLLFIAYLSFAYLKQLNKNARILLFTVYPLFYVVAVIAGYASWGLAVPVVGWVGGVLTKFIFFDNNRWNDKESLAFGFSGLLISVIGLILFFVFMNQFNMRMGIGMGLTVAGWQVIIGWRLIWTMKEV